MYSSTKTIFENISEEDLMDVNGGTNWTAFDGLIKNNIISNLAFGGCAGGDPGTGGGYPTTWRP